MFYFFIFFGLSVVNDTPDRILNWSLKPLIPTVEGIFCSFFFFLYFGFFLNNIIEKSILPNPLLSRVSL